jgi:hypothetical protein
MKRPPRSSAKLAATARALDTRRLNRVRGGDGLGITTSVPDPKPPVMELQHNEALIRL